MCFWAMSDMEKNGTKIGGEDGKSIFIQPMAFKYTYPRDVTSALRDTLRSMEMKLGIKADDDDTMYQRMRVLAEKMLSTLEKEYGLKSNSEGNWNDRVKALRWHILKSLAKVLNVELPENARELECVRILRNKLDDFIFEDEKNKSKYEKEIHEEKERSYKIYYRDLNRVVNFICIYDGYVTERMTQERYADVIERMESEIYGGDPAIKGPREVLIDVGEAIDLSLYYEAYKKEKKQTIAKVTDEIFNQISTMLAQLETVREPRYIK